MTSTPSQLQNIHAAIAASVANAHDHFLNAIFIMPVKTIWPPAPINKGFKQ